MPNGSKAPHTRNVIGRQAAMNVDGVGAANSFPKSLRTTLATKSTERHMFHHAIDVDAHTSPISCKAPEDPDHLMPNTGLPQVCDTDGLTRKNFFSGTYLMSTPLSRSPSGVSTEGLTC